MTTVAHRLVRLACSRRGASAIALAAGSAFAAEEVQAAANPLVIFVFALPSAWLTVWVVAGAWSSRTWPATPSWAKPRDTSPMKQLREDPNARIHSDRGGFLFERRHFFTATGLPPMPIDNCFHARAEAQQHESPVLIAENDSRRWWWYADMFFWENCGYDARDVQALVSDRERKRQRQLERAHLLLQLEQADAQPRREPVPREVRRAVFDRDGGRCVECGSNFDLQYDHVIPVALGGATTAENLQLLCLDCNLAKGASL